jgi:hypothetical protein
MDLTLRAEIGRLKWQDRVLRDVDAHILIENDSLLIPELRLRLDEGLAVEVSGALNAISSTPSGSLAGVVSAPSPTALEMLAGLLQVPEAWRPSDQRANAMTPLRLAYRLQLPSASKPELTIALDGDARGMRVVADSKLAATTSGWADMKADVALDLSGNDARGLLAVIAPQAAGLADRVGSAPARLSIRGLGDLGSGVFASVSLDSEGMVAAYSGPIKGLQTASAMRLDGKLTFKGEMQRAFVLAGLGRRPGIGTQGVEGNVRITSTDDALQIEAQQLKLDGVQVTGAATVTSKAGRRDIDARVAAEHTSLPRLLALVLDGRSASTTPRTPGTWPEEAFDLSNLDGVNATIVLTTPELSLTEGLRLRDARLKAVLADGSVDVSSITGRALDAPVEGSFKLERTPGGASLTGRVAIKGASLEALGSSEGGAAAVGTASAHLQVSAKATNPRGLVASLLGKGAAEIGDARLRRFTPKAVRATAEAYLQSKDVTSPEAVRGLLAEGLANGDINVGKRHLALSIQDGRLTVEELAVATPEGRLTTRIALDLSSLKLDSEWRIEAKSVPTPGKDEARPTMPPVTITYTGPISALGTLEPQLKSDAFERELVVRRMERDVEQLERLRKQDEERARNEAERLRRIEHERLESERLRRLEAAREPDPASAVSPAPPASASTPPPERPPHIILPSASSGIIVPPKAPAPSATATPAPDVPAADDPRRAPQVRAPVAPRPRPRFSPFPTDGG